MGKTVTIIDIAKDSGYSVTTVSRVLNLFNYNFLAFNMEKWYSSTEIKLTMRYEQ